MRLVNSMISAKIQKAVIYYDGIKSTNVVSFVLAFAGMVTYFYFHSDVTFKGDSYEIWEIAKHFYDPLRNTSFVEYRGPFTFFFYNLITSVSQLIQVSDVVLFRVFSALLFALLTTYCIPYLFSYILNKRICLMERVLYSVIIYYFYSGYFLHPQTDFLAFTFLLLSINALIHASGKSQSYWWIYCIAGVLLACSIMTRLNYILSVPFLILFIVFLWKRGQHNINKLLEIMALFIVPLTLLVSSNILLNNYIDEEKSSTGNGLLEFQLLGGLKTQKIEWNAGDYVHKGHLFFPEKRGEKILKIESIDSDYISVEQYIDLYLKYPVDMFSINLLHLFNAFDITYDSVYITDLRSPRVLLSMLNYSLMFLALVVINLKYSGWLHDKKYSLLLLMSIFIPAIPSVAFIGEVRYFIPVMTSFFAISIFSLGDAIKVVNEKSLWWVLFIFIALCFMNSVNTFNSLDNIVPLKVW